MLKKKNYNSSYTLSCEFKKYIHIKIFDNALSEAF